MARFEVGRARAQLRQLELSQQDVTWKVLLPVLIAALRQRYTCIALTATADGCV